LGVDGSVTGISGYGLVELRKLKEFISQFTAIAIHARTKKETSPMASLYISGKGGLVLF